MATYTAYEPKWKAPAGVLGPQIQQLYFPAQNAAWRKGSLLINVTTGTIVTPTGGTSTSFTNATGANTPGPLLGFNTPFNITSSSYSLTQGAVTVTASTSATAPAATYFCEVSYTITATTESVPSAPFLINCPAGLLPSVNVTATGAPAGATTYAFYAGLYPGQYMRQSAVTALGTATALTYPLTNSVGLNQAASNVSSGIIGMADCDSDAYYAGVLGATAGGSQQTSKRSLFGATQSYGPGFDYYPFALPVVKLQSGLIEASIVQAWNPALIGSSVGWTLNTVTGYFTADTTATAAGTIQGLSSQPFQGDVGDFFARVLVLPTQSTLA
jgi:hypothetical protein